MILNINQINNNILLNNINANNSIKSFFNYFIIKNLRIIDYLNK